MLPTILSSGMVYSKIIYSSDSDTVYVFYADEP